MFSVYGLCFASGVYVSLIDTMTMTRSIGVALLFSSFGFTVCGLALHGADGDAAYRSGPRAVGILSALLVACQALVALALHLDASNWMIYGASAAYGLGCGCNYIIGLSVLQAWVPERPGFVTALGMLFIPIGSTIGVYWYRTAADALGGAVPAMACTSLTCAALTLICAMFTTRPPRGWHPDQLRLKETLKLISVQTHPSTNRMSGSFDAMLSTHAAQSMETRFDDKTAGAEYGSMTALSILQENKLNRPFRPIDEIKEQKKADFRSKTLSLHEMLMSKKLYPFMISMLAMMVPGSGFSVAYPHMLVMSFGESTETANRWLISVHIMGILGRVFGGAAIDYMGGRKPGVAGLAGSRSVFSLIMFLQTAAIAIMPIALSYHLRFVFTAACATVYFCLSSGAVVSGCLARNIFTPYNSSLAFSLFGTANGVMDLLQFHLISGSSSETSVANSMLSTNIAELRPRAFDSFILLVFVLSLIGSICVTFLTHEPAAYRKAKLPERPDTVS